ncbi:MAG: NAD(P)-dependent oxidoreductase [Variovorax sp.]|nr:NAD(P)-dependent oxidoreductase [Variovorax sp.]
MQPHGDTLGFVGLGHMGAAIAQRLVASGHALVVHDLDASAVEQLVSAGAKPAADARDVAQRCATVFMCLPSPDASHAVCRQMLGGSALRVVVETSTVGPEAIRRLAAELAAGDVALLDAPVSGGPRGAQAGTLSVMYAGAPATVRAALAPLQAVAGKLFHVGDVPGLAQVCKLVNNAISAAGMIAACEGAVLGVKAGLDAQTLLDAINAGSGRNAATMDKFPRSILTGSFDYGGPMGLMLKDLSLYIEQASAAGVHNTMAPATLAAWTEAVRRSGPDADYSEVIRHMEADAGAQVRARAPRQGSASDSRGSIP